MRIARSLGLAAFLLLWLVGSTILAQEARGPKMLLKEEVFDFGEVKEGEVIEHAFEITNAGTETLEIKDVKPG